MMKRILALLLCITCLVGVLASCTVTPVEPVDTTAPADTTPPPAEDAAPLTHVELTQYTIVYPKSASDRVKAAAASLKVRIDAIIGGAGIAMISDDQASTTPYEILVGATSREASRAVYAEGAKPEFSIRNASYSVIIAGFSDALVEEGAAYFAKTYLASAAENKIAVVTEYTGTLENTVLLSTATVSAMKVVYQEDNQIGIATGVIDKIKAATGIIPSRVKADPNYSYNASTFEVLIGSYAFDAFKDVEAALRDDGYVLAVRGNKIVITATSAEHYTKAVEALTTLLSEHRLYETKGVLLKNGATVREIGDELLNAVPGASVLPTGIYPAGDGAYLAIFEGVKENFFREYLAALENANLTKYTESDFSGRGTLNKNYFATYISDKVSVDVGFHLKGWVGFVEQFSDGIMYVTVSPRDGLTLPRQSEPDYVAVDSNQYPMILTQVGLGDYHVNEASNCYIVRLADGSFIIHDSGYGGSLSPRTTADAIYDILKKQAPDKNNIVISAWITTHPHRDHMDGLEKFANKYATDPTITVKQFVQNFADESISNEVSNQNAVYNSIKKFGAGVEVVKPHAGNVLYYPGVKFNILYTQEEHTALHRGTLFHGNASSMVMQMVTADGCTVFFGADSPQMDTHDNGLPYTYGAIHKWYGSFIQSYVLTYFHHGLGGGSSWDANATIKPKIVLWPITWGKINTGTNYTALMNSSHSIYFNKISANSLYNSFAEGIMHSTPNYMGVIGWFVADDNIHVLTFGEGKAVVTTYDTHAAYLQ